MTSSNVEWPTCRIDAGESLFRTDCPDWQHNAVTAQCYARKPAWDLYTDGYRSAADAVVRAMLDHEAYVDAAVYPIGYLYRHHFELVFKSICVISKELLQQKSEPPTGHRLLSLWRKTRKLMEEAAPDADWSQNDDVDHLIGEFDEVDRQSQSFRYPVNTNGKRPLLDRDRMNVRHFATVAAMLSDYLVEIRDGFESQQYLIREWEGEIARYGGP